MIMGRPDSSKVLITGAAGFIGFHLAKRLLEEGYTVVGLDNINAYYDVGLKFGRLAQTGIPREKIRHRRFVRSEHYPGYRFIKLDLEDDAGIRRLVQEGHFTHVCHLAGQAGVGYSLINPRSYIQSNIDGFLNILEACRDNGLRHLVFASSSSVYGLNEKMPFSTKDNVDHPVSIYAASKKSDELMAHVYSHLFRIPATGLRFFTVYGPWGRPDMALFKFTKAILEGRPLDVFNHGRMKRDFTYIDDIVEGIVRVLFRVPKPDPLWSGSIPDPSSSSAPYKIYNIGNSRPVPLMNFIKAIEKALGKRARLNFLPAQPGDVPATFADVSELKRDFGYAPRTPVRDGIRKFLDWYLDFYRH